MIEEDEFSIWIPDGRNKKHRDQIQRGDFLTEVRTKCEMGVDNPCRVEGWGDDGSVRKILTVQMCKHRDLRIDPQHPCKKPRVVTCNCNPKAGKVHTGKHGAYWQASLVKLVSSWFSERVCLE